MKTFTIALLVSAALGCGNNAGSKSTEETLKTTISTENTVEKDDQQTILTGVISRDDLQQAPYKSWFDKTFDSYQPSEEALEVIGNKIHDYEIEVFMGTWCGDSRREVPKLFKILEEVNYDLDKVEVVAVDRNKTVPENLEHTAEFEMVPTIIFYKDGKEVNRFVEFAQETLEEDIAKIVSEQGYKNPYAE